ncbi:ABC transporter permease [Lichenifustis flavocetrariae]|uniref:Iron export ABC transporter permease subunit FetB n=1 Tax=Lichenifustis flavocetrariae TaxID=2949735 RepID=A0AA41Z332_9HYPH|nr:iron export ABC transporter permease subunit FetB [Lichenifustis flavocetrariae]MCW6512112.1 iron export ABC transporter permease subunit FetB [Lichenifustis flavocetrariae]
MTPVALSPADLAVAAMLVVASAALSLVLSLGVHRPLLVSAGRLVIQLVLVGLVLRVIFASASMWVTFGVIAIMLAAASREMGARSPRRLKGLWHLGIGTLSILGATLPVALIVLLTALKPTPWYDARHAIPLVGIILGTVMNGGSLALNTILSSVARDRLAIEARLALGATRQEAFRPILRQAVRTGVTPTVNQMAAAGIITLPGIMTGQVLAGMDPLDAARYQILLLLVLSTAGFLGAVIASYAALHRLTDHRHRLRLDALV